MKETYRTIKAPAFGEFKDRGSRFIGCAYPVSSVEEVNSHIAELRNEHLKSRHVCYAFSIGLEEPMERFNDDGEPSGSAGRPIIGQIHSNELNNTLVAVVRYFGGTKLGVPGLINAYKTASAEALNTAEIVTRSVGAIFVLEFGYDKFHDVMNYLKQENVFINEQVTDADCVFTVTIDLPKKLIFEETLRSMDLNRVDYKGTNA